MSRETKYMRARKEAERLAAEIDPPQEECRTPVKPAEELRRRLKFMYTEKLRRSLTRLRIDAVTFAAMQERGVKGRIRRTKPLVELRDALCHDLYTNEMLSYPEIAWLVFGNNGNATAHEAVRRHKRWLST